MVKKKCLISNASIKSLELTVIQNIYKVPTDFSSDCIYNVD